MRILCVFVLLTMCAVGAGFKYSGGANNEGGKNEDKVSIEEVMKTAMKGGLNKKVISGEATTEEKMQFLGLMIDLVENDPPQGDSAEWKAMAGNVLINAAKVAVGREGAGDALKEATNCKSCHDKFKPAN